MSLLSHRKIEAYIPSSTHPFHTLSITKTPSSPPSTLWILYIHGGAWRDPTQTKTTGHPLLDGLIANTKTPVNTASIDYRLSSHPVHPPVGDTVTHPKHVFDVISAIEYLVRVHDMKRYILVGHSAGATLALQALPGRWHWERRMPGGEDEEEVLGSSFVAVPKPSAIVGLEGIYDLELLVDEYPDYNGFIEGAFGDSGEDWRNASPAHMDLGNIILPGENLPDGKDENADATHQVPTKVVLVQSSEDELLSLKQTQRMKDAFLEQFSTVAAVDARNLISVVEVKGKHNEVPSSEEVLDIVLSLVNAII